MKSSALESGEVRLADYESVVIYDSATALFIELELERLLEDQGLRVVGEKEAPELREGGVLAVRYMETPRLNAYGNRIGNTLTVLLEDFTTGRTLLTASGTATYASRDAAWQEVSHQLKLAFGRP